jgi:hypothetical protein
MLAVIDLAGTLVVEVDSVIGPIDKRDNTTMLVTFLLLARSTKNLYTTSIQDVVCGATMLVGLHMASST